MRTRGGNMTGNSISSIAIDCVSRAFAIFLKRKSNLADRTIRLYTAILRACFLRLNPFNTTPEEIEDKIRVSADLAPSTRRNYVIVLRIFGRWLMWEGVSSRNTAYSVKLPARGRRKARDLQPEVVKEIFRHCKDNRERVIVTLLYYSGLRADELLSLKLSDVDIKHQWVWVQNGKGGKERFVPYIMDKAVTDLINRYIQEYNITDWFIETQRGKMSYWTLNELLKNIGSRFNFRFSAHQLRHSIATHLYNGDMDLIALRDFLGHSDVQTTQQYVRVYVDTVKRKYNSAQLVKNIC